MKGMDFAEGMIHRHRLKTYPRTLPDDSGIVYQANAKKQSTFKKQGDYETGKNLSAWEEDNRNTRPIQHVLLFNN